MTVFFADVANYTSVSEKLDPEEVHQIMDGCFRTLMDEIHRYQGTINQFTGDGVMALFGAPLAHEAHAQRARHAALSTQKAVEEFGERVLLARVQLAAAPLWIANKGLQSVADQLKPAFQ